MKHIAVAIALMAAANAANAITPYQGSGIFFPDETSPKGLPQAIPCTIKPNFTGKESLICIWLGTARHVDIFDSTTQQSVRYTNQIPGACRRGVCRVSNGEVGNWPMEIPFLLSIWYYIGESTDGRAVAYLDKTGPAFGGKAVTYAEAGNKLHELYLNAGLPDQYIAQEMDNRYHGGFAQWKKDVSATVGTPPKINGDIKEAWCNPRMDDDCSINGKKVPVAELGKYLPALDPSEVEADGGTCEYPICYDASYKPVGIREGH